MAMTMERETHDQAIVRLAGEAAARGVTVYRAGSEWFAPSRTRPGTLHRVTAYSCDCPGFARHQRCGHHSALLAHLGWLPAGDPEPTPPAAPIAMAVPSTACPSCHGEGHRRMSTGGGLGDWQYVDCRRCRRAAA